MKDTEPAKGYDEREIDGNRSEDSRSQRFNRDDLTSQTDAYKAFTKDKRTRITSRESEKVEYRPRRDFESQQNDPGQERRPSGQDENQRPGNYGFERGGDSYGDRPRQYNNPNREYSGDPAGGRRSYNPNFTSDNKPRFERKDYGERPQYGDNRGNRPEYNRYNKPEYDRGERPEYDRERRPEYSERPQYGNNGDRPRYDNRGERKPYNSRPSGSYDGGNRYGDGNRSQGRTEYNRDGNGNGNQNRRGYGRNYGEQPRRSYQNNDSRPDDFGNRYGDESRPYVEGDRRNSAYGRPSYNKPPRDNAGRYGYDKPAYNNSGYGRPSYDNQGYRRPAGNRPGGYNNSEYDGNSRPQRYDSRPRPQFRPKQQPNAPKPRKSFDYPTFPVENLGEPIRLNRYIAMSGICSRREADEFIKSGIVSVNGNVITELGAKVNAGDEVQFNGNVLVNEKKVYIVMNKPKGFVTSVDDPHAEKTVMGLLKNNCRERVYPVGRLDKSSSGVLLITNDGDLAKKLMHPSFQKKKIYQVTLDKPLTHADMDSLAAGITLEDGEIHADAISYVASAKTEIGIEIHSGRNRIVRRMFEHLGYRVTKLDRVYFAGLTKEKLKRGKWRFLTTEEAQILRSGMYE